MCFAVPRQFSEPTTSVMQKPTSGIFFLVPVLTKVVGRLTLVSFHFSALISVFVLELFLFPDPHTVFFPFETSPLPTCSHLPIPLTLTYLLTYTFKFKIDSLPPTYSPVYLKCDTLIPTYLPAPPQPIYLPTYSTINLPICPSIFLHTSPLGRYLLDPTYLVAPTYMAAIPINLTIVNNDEEKIK